jgi:cyclopropane fatty-acyl-phospholipid synthase-like methyltransferase
MPKLRGIFVAPYALAREALTRSDIGRVPEPMVMEEPESVAAFHEAGRIDASSTPIYEMCTRALSRLIPEGGSVFDLGSGSGRFLAHLARHRPDVQMVGVDLSEPMLETGRQLLAEEGLEDRVELRRADVTNLDDAVPDKVDVISCIWTLHQLPTAEHVDECLREVAAVRRAHGCAVFLADFGRLKNPRTFPLMVSAASNVPRGVIADGVASERAAWTFDELTHALERAELGHLHHALMSPLHVFQIHWARAIGVTDDTDQRLWREVQLPLRSRLETAIWWHQMRNIPGRKAASGDA